MGTNFYCKKLDKKHRKEFSDDLNELSQYITYNIDNIELDLVEKVKEFIESNSDLEEEIHLGKRSYGWQFLWDYHNGKYFKPNLESIKNFLSQDNIAIYNEYGEHFTVDQLFNDELNNSLYKDSTHDDGMNGGYSEYYFKSEDGLRFSKFEDFS